MKGDNWVLLNWREDGALVPHSKYDREKVQKRVKEGRYQIRAQIAQIRSLPQLRLYWPWIRLVAENCPVNMSERLLHGMLLHACGYTEPFIDIHGNMQLVPSSIAFDGMQQDEFDDYFNRAQEIVSTKIIPGVDLKELMNSVKSECNWKEAA